MKKMELLGHVVIQLVTILVLLILTVRVYHDQGFYSLFEELRGYLWDDPRTSPLVRNSLYTLLLINIVNHVLGRNIRVIAVVGHMMVLVLSAGFLLLVSFGIAGVEDHGVLSSMIIMVAGIGMEPAGYVGPLVMLGAEIQATDIMIGRTPLHYATMFHRPKTVIELLFRGASIESVDFEGMTPLGVAVNSSFPILVDVLVHVGNADVNARIFDRFSLVHWAVLEKDYIIAKQLLDFGADINIQETKYQVAPLHVAAGDDLNMTILLLKYDPMINIEDMYGYRPIDVAWAKNQSDTIQLLLDHGAEWGTPDVERSHRDAEARRKDEE